MKLVFPILVITNIILTQDQGLDYSVYKAAQDYTVPLFSDKVNNRSALFIFPHPDDEITCAGTIDQLNKKGWITSVLTLTQGQSNEKEIRSAEWKNSMKVLQVDNCELLDLLNNSWDNVLNNKIEFWYDHQDSLEKIVYTAIIKYQPSLVFTQDSALGGYGHPEHRMVGVIISNVLKKHQKDTLFPVSRILQVTIPEKMEQLMLGNYEPYQLAKKYTGNNTLPEPTVAFDISGNWNAKRMATAAHRSQIGEHLKLFYLPEDKDTAIHFNCFDREYFYEITKSDK